MTTEGSNLPSREALMEVIRDRDESDPKGLRFAAYHRKLELMQMVTDGEIGVLEGLEEMEALDEPTRKQQMRDAIPTDYLLPIAQRKCVCSRLPADAGECGPCWARGILDERRTR